MNFIGAINFFVIHLFMELSTDLSLPHEPELEDVHMPAALYSLVSRIIGDIILFIRLEKIASTH